MPSFRRHPESVFKLFSVIFIVFFYIVWSAYYDPPLRLKPKPSGPSVQYEKWKEGVDRADAARLKRVEDAVGHLFHGYRVKAWGFDDIQPVSGKGINSKYGWGGFVVEAAPRLALMGMWDEFGKSLDYIVNKIDFSRSHELVDPAIATKRYLGSLVSILDLADAGLINDGNMTAAQKEKVMDKAVILAHKLLPAYATIAGLPFPRVDFLAGEGMPRPAGASDNLRLHEREYAIEPSDAATFLENAAFTRLMGDPEFYLRSVKAWAPLVFDQYIESLHGLVAGPVDIFSSQPEGLQRHWDAGHGAYYEALLKAIMLAPRDKLSRAYQRRWLQAASGVRHNLTSRSIPAENHAMQHLYIGKWDGNWHLNEMSQEACSVPGILILGGKYLQRPNLITLAQALLEGCRHVYVSSPSGVGADSWSWVPMPLSPNGTFEPITKRSIREVHDNGYWVSDSSFKLRPNYFASLFYAWRMTGEQRYRDWALEAFIAVEKDCKTPFGFAGLRDIMGGYAGRANWIDEVDGGMALESLMWLWLMFADTDVMSLDKWVFTTRGYPLKRG